MKLIIAIVQKEDAFILSDALTEGGFYVTKLATKGGFLSMDNITLLIGTQADMVDTVLDIIKKVCNNREQIVSSPMPGIGSEAEMHTYPLKINVGGSTVFVVDVDRFEKF